MEKKKKKSLLYPAIFMLILSAILTSILATLAQQTKPIVAKNEEIALKSKILYTFNIKNEGTEESILKTFDEKVKDTGEKFNDEPIFKHEENGDIKGYAIAVKGPGLWGAISGYIALDKDYKKILGIDFIKQSETPGLGGRIEEEFYKSQYRDVAVDKVSEEVDAISGATQTSRFVSKLVKDGLTKFLKEKGVSN